MGSEDLNVVLILKTLLFAKATHQRCNYSSIFKRQIRVETSLHKMEGQFQRIKDSVEIEGDPSF